MSDTPDLTMKGLQNIKMELDAAINSAWTQDANSIDKVSTSQLIEMKNGINELLGRFDARYRDAAPSFAGTMREEDAVALGERLISGTVKSAPINEVRRYVSSMTDAERGYLQDGALRWLTGQADKSPGFLKKLGKSNPDLMNRLSVIFGDTVDEAGLERLANSVQGVYDSTKKYAAVSAANEAGTKHAVVKGGAVSGVVDSLAKLAVGTKVGTGQLNSGTLFSNLIRLAREPSDMANQVIFDLLQTTDKATAEKAIATLADALLKPKVGLKGAGAGAAGLGSIMDN